MLTQPGVRLTEARKKGTFKTNVMPKTTAPGIALACLGLSLVFGCAGPRLSDQVGFGIWAAHQELWNEAIFRWQKAVAQNPRSVAAHNNLAVAYEKKGRWEEARKEYETALKLAPDNPWVKLNFKNFKDNLEPGESGKKAKAPPDEKK
jgi:tetratricopeptide (TPR) repeat protein